MVRTRVNRVAARKGGIQNIEIGAIFRCNPDIDYATYKRHFLKMLLEKGFKRRDMKLRKRGRPSAKSPRSKRSLAPITTKSAPSGAKTAESNASISQAGSRERSDEPALLVVAPGEGGSALSSRLAAPDRARALITRAAEGLGGIQFVDPNQLAKESGCEIQTIRLVLSYMRAAAGFASLEFPTVRTRPNYKSEKIIRSYIQKHADLVGGIGNLIAIEAFVGDLPYTRQSVMKYFCLMRAEAGLDPEHYPGRRSPPQREVDASVRGAVQKLAKTVGGIQNVDPAMVRDANPDHSLEQYKRMVVRMRKEAGLSPSNHPDTAGIAKSRMETAVSDALRDAALQSGGLENVNPREVRAAYLDIPREKIVERLRNMRLEEGLPMFGYPMTVPVRKIRRLAAMPCMSGADAMLSHDLSERTRDPGAGASEACESNPGTPMAAPPKNLSKAAAEIRRVIGEFALRQGGIQHVLSDQVKSSTGASYRFINGQLHAMLREAGFAHLAPPPRAPIRKPGEIDKLIRRAITEFADKVGGIRNVSTGQIRSIYGFHHQPVTNQLLVMLREAGFSEKDLKRQPRGRPSGETPPEHMTRSRRIKIAIDQAAAKLGGLAYVNPYLLAVSDANVTMIEKHLRRYRQDAGLAPSFRDGSKPALQGPRARVRMSADRTNATVQTPAKAPSEDGVVGVVECEKGPSLPQQRGLATDARMLGSGEGLSAAWREALSSGARALSALPLSVGERTGSAG